MKEFKLEITYEIKGNPVKTSWIYLTIRSRSFDNAVASATKHFNQWARECGWSKIVTVKKIAPLSNWHDKAPIKNNSRLSSARPTRPAAAKPGKSLRKRSNGTDTKKPKRTNKRTKPTTASTDKPKRNRKVTEPAVRKPKSKSKPTSSRSSGAKTTKRRNSTPRNSSRRRTE